VEEVVGLETAKKAVKEAKSKAESLASAAGLTLGRIINVQESDNSSPRPVPYLAKELSVGMGGGAADKAAIRRVRVPSCQLLGSDM